MTNLNRKGGRIRTFVPLEVQKFRNRHRVKGWLGRRARIAALTVALAIAIEIHIAKYHMQAPDLTDSHWIALSTPTPWPTGSTSNQRVHHFTILHYLYWFLEAKYYSAEVLDRDQVGILLRRASVRAPRPSSQSPFRQSLRSHNGDRTTHGSRA